MHEHLPSQSSSAVLSHPNSSRWHLTSFSSILQMQSQNSVQNPVEIGGRQLIPGAGSVGTSQKQFSVQVSAIDFGQVTSLGRHQMSSSSQEQAQVLMQKEEETGFLHFTSKAFEVIMRLNKIVRTNRRFIVLLFGWCWYYGLVDKWYDKKLGRKYQLDDGLAILYDWASVYPLSWCMHLAAPAPEIFSREW